MNGSSAILALGLLLTSACHPPAPTVREPRRTLTPLPPEKEAAEEAAAARKRERGPVRSLATSDDLESLAPKQSWNVVTTESFRLLHLGAPQAQRVADEAERHRKALVATWVGGATARAAWRPRCEIALYATKQQLRAMIGGGRNVGVARARQARLTPGRMLERRIQLAADDPELYAATLPHEIAHIVLRDALHGHRPPLWANEGMAQLSESPPLQQRYRSYVLRALAHEHAIPLGELLALREYPAAPHKQLFYAQSHSLAAFLVARNGPRAFISFLDDTRRSGPRRALQRAYGFASISALTAAWREAAKRPVEPTVARRRSAWTSRGSLPRETIQRVITREVHRVTACYEEQLRRAPGLSGRIDVEFVIAATGTVRAAKATSIPAGWERGPGQAVTQCIVAAIRQLRFPPPRGGGGVLVSYPFVLRTP